MFTSIKTIDFEKFIDQKISKISKMSNRMHNSHELPPKMAHKAAVVVPVPQQTQYYQQFQGIVQQTYQPRIQPMYQEVVQNQYQYGRAQGQVVDSYRYMQSSKRTQSQQQVQRGEDRNVAVDSRPYKPPVINPNDPPKSFNIIKRGNLPGLLFEQVYVM